RSGHDAWLDVDGDFERGEGEKSVNANMMAAGTVDGDRDENGERAEGRLVVIADADFVTHQIISSPGNALVLYDSLQWMLGEEELVATVTSEEDVPIEHTREEDKIWFYATSLGVPLPLFGLGIWVVARRRRARPEKKRKPRAPAV